MSICAWRVVGLTIPPRPPVWVPNEARPAASRYDRISAVVGWRPSSLMFWLNEKNSMPRYPTEARNSKTSWKPPGSATSGPRSVGSSGKLSPPR